ncbi:hypothetical protein M513_00478 [Trichuris suis]|uniref:Uncharacterized protein n=1 Tax=Trichuris suis TaxID=68888 RepID=A0A085MNI9_9BILA|nr:hypothetical protein M513_00478 [Trichuris suis]
MPRRYTERKIIFSQSVNGILPVETFVMLSLTPTQTYSRDTYKAEQKLAGEKDDCLNKQTW